MNRLAGIAERFLSEQSFSLIVAPALADFAFERAQGRGPASYRAVIAAVLLATYEDVTSDPGSVLTFLSLALIPTVYYVFFFMLCAPAAVRSRPPHSVWLTLLAIVLALSTLSAVVCYWPAPLPRRHEAEGP